MPPTRNDQFPFWEFVDPSRAPGNGVDHSGPTFAWPFNTTGGPPHPPHPPHPPRHPRHNHHQHRRHPRGPGGPFAPWWSYQDEPETDTNRAAGADPEKDHPMADGSEKEKSPDTLQGDNPDPAEVTPDEDDFDQTHQFPFRGCGRRDRRWNRRGGRRGEFNFQDAMRGFMNHPFFQHMGDAANRYRDAAHKQDTGAFSPPADVFNTVDAYVVHVALPGAKKDDIGVSWDPETSLLRISGVVHRPGDEEFLKTLHNGERRVGEFEREISLPPAGVSEKEEVDGEGITAKLEDGVLVITVRKVEKEWTEVRKVDIL